MTTIAAQGGEGGMIAADTQLTSAGYVVRVQKIVRLPDGGIAAAAGLWRAGYPGLRWLAGGELGDAPDIEGATIVILRPDGSLWIAEESFPAYPILDSHVAIGCGQDLARMAMANGRNPVEAVADACELDNTTSGPIQSMSICQRAEFPPADVYVEKKARKRK